MIRVSVNGSVLPGDEARTSVLDRGFLYGDSVFEVLRTFGGKPFALDQHLARLEASARLIAIEVFPKEKILLELEALLAMVEEGESYIRVVLSRGAGTLNLDSRANVEGPTRVVIVSPLRPQPEEIYRDGVRVALVRTSHDHLAAGAKASMYIPNILALRRANDVSAYEAILVGPCGELLEGATSNLFLIKGGELWTPKTTLGVLAGITRKFVLEIARELGIVVKEDVFFARDLYTADEAFLTSTLRGLVPITSADSVQLGGGTPGPRTQRVGQALAHKRSGTRN